MLGLKVSPSKTDQHGRVFKEENGSLPSLTKSSALQDWISIFLPTLARFQHYSRTIFNTKSNMKERRASLSSNPVPASRACFRVQIFDAMKKANVLRSGP